MISAIFILFQAILSKSSVTADIFLRALSNPFLKSKVPLGYPKILMTVGLIIIQILQTAKQYFHVSVSRHESQDRKRKKWLTSTVNLALHKDLSKDLILKKPKREVRLD